MWKKSDGGSRHGSESRREEEKSTGKWWDLGSQLYDSHELVSINHLIERHLLALPGSWSNRLSRKFSSLDADPDAVRPIMTERIPSVAHYKESKKSGAGCFAFFPCGRI
ncbi:hypothetical protein LINGRAHAP2_LOCUS332 [Linum grandiflorum]